VKRKRMEDVDSLQLTADSLKRKTRRKDNAEAQRARRLAENAEGVGRLRLTVDSLQMTVWDSEGDAETQGALRFAEGLGMVGISVGPFALLRASLSGAGNECGPDPESINRYDGEMITRWVRNIYGTKGQRGDSCTTRGRLE
jgi:hypothetical protein